ncbi:MAG: serine-type D-Ala-D-Ala carboxypeptidase [Gammaproteobacteria bacterium]|nr:serine-type D-Ala-D-Ala carboxypeptidase [Gammaproteobacteria bacterium]
MSILVFRYIGLLVLLFWPFLGTASPMVPPPSISSSSYVLMDMDTGQVLADKNSKEPLAPASLTKIMTSYVIAVELEESRISLSDEVPVSVSAWRTPGSRMFIREGTKVRLEDLLRGIIVQSGNDASVALAEYIAGSEEAFADIMNAHASELGMENTVFENSTGLPGEQHVSSAYDLAILTRALIKRFPEIYSMYAERSFSYNNIEQPNRNRLLWRDRRVDGVKTGHTRDAGYCLAASATQDGMRLISVVMGAENDQDRMRESQQLLSYGFRYYKTHKLYDSNETIKSARLWYGTSEEVELGVLEDVFVTIPRGRYDQMDATVDLVSVIEAPVVRGQKFGELRVILDDEIIYSSDVRVLNSIDEAGFFGRLSDGVELLFERIFFSE